MEWHNHYSEVSVQALDTPAVGSYLCDKTLFSTRCLNILKQRTEFNEWTPIV